MSFDVRSQNVLKEIDSCGIICDLYTNKNAIPQPTRWQSLPELVTAPTWSCNFITIHCVSLNYLFILNKPSEPLPTVLDKDFVILSGVKLESLGSLALCANFCSKPGKDAAIAPVTIGDNPNLLVRLLIRPPSIALVTGLPDVKTS